MFSNCSSSAAKQIQIHNDEKWNEGAPGKFPAARKCIQPVSITDHTPQLGHLLRTCLDIRNVLFFSLMSLPVQSYMALRHRKIPKTL